MTEEKEEYVLPYQGPRMSKQVEILRAYYILSKQRKDPIGYKEVADLTKISEISISGNNKFFVYCGFLEEVDRKYIPSEQLIEFINRLEWKKEAEAKVILRQMLARTWFFKSLLELMQLKREMSKDEIINDLGAKAGVRRSRSNMWRLNRLFEWIDYAGILLESNDGAYRVAQITRNEATKELPARLPKQSEEIFLTKPGTLIEVEPSIVFAINVTPNTTEEELKQMLELTREYIRKESNDSRKVNR